MIDSELFDDSVIDLIELCDCSLTNSEVFYPVIDGEFKAGSLRISSIILLSFS